MEASTIKNEYLGKQEDCSHNKCAKGHYKEDPTLNAFQRKLPGGG